MVEMIKARINQQKEFTVRMCEIDNRLIQELHKARKDLIKRYYLGDLEEKYLKVMEEVFRNKNIKDLKGKEAK